MKKFFLSLTFFLSISLAFSYGGFMSGEKNLKVIKTEWFDIIFPEKCEVDARKIAAVADSYYSEISSELGTEPYQRFPVSITTAVENLNAFFSPAPYNMICLFDTPLDENLDSSEGIESIFYHELTHAVTLNMKSPFWRGLSVMADFLTLPGISLTSFWYEGASVSFESLGDGGRLNSPFFTQVVAQAKIDGKFPSWRDVTGARDVYPSGSVAYYFGGAFAKYIRQTYGAEKYGEFWKKAGKSTTLSFCAGIFKKTYGIKMSDAWKNFRDSIDVSDFENPADSSRFESEILSKKKSVVSAFDVRTIKSAGSDKEKSYSIAAFFDSPSNGVFLYSTETKKTKRLFSVTDVKNLALSPDGKYIAVSRICVKANEKVEIGIYDIENRKYRKISTSGMKNASVCKKGGGFFVTAFDFSSPKKKIVRLSFDEKFRVLEKSGEIELSDDEIPYSLTSLGENRIAFIVKKALSWKIRIADFESEKIDEYDFGKTILHNLHVVRDGDDSCELALSFATLGEKIGTLSKCAIARIDKSSFNMSFLPQENPLPFGIINFSMSENGDEFFFVGEKYDERPFFVSESLVFGEKIQIESKCISFANAENDEKYEIADEKNEVAENSEISAEEIGFSFSSYNPLKYFFHGAVLPFSLSSAYDTDFDSASSQFLGVTFASSTPWTDKITIFSAGFSPFSKTYGCSLSVRGGNDAVSYSASGSANFDNGGFLQTVDSVSVGAVLYRFLFGAISAGAYSNFFYGEEVSDEKYVQSGTHSKSGAYVLLSRKRKSRPSANQIIGYSVKPFLVFDYKDIGYNIIENKVEKKYLNVGGSLTSNFPGLFPLSFSATLFPEESCFLHGSAVVTLFSYEIQKGIPAFSVYANRISLKAAYSGKISYVNDEFFDIQRVKEIATNVRKDDYSDALSLSASITMSPNTSYFVSALQFSLGCAFVYRPNPAVGKKKYQFGFTFSSSL